jgi:hypothetical protein
MTPRAEPIIFHQHNVHTSMPSCLVAQKVIEDSPPSSSPSPVVKKESRLKHFFSPIRRKVPPPPPPPPLPPSQPDLFISNVLPSNMSIQQQQFQKADAPMQLDANLTHPEHSSTTTTGTSSSSFQVSTRAILRQFALMPHTFFVVDGRKSRGAPVRYREFIKRHYGATNSLCRYSSREITSH